MARERALVPVVAAVAAMLLALGAATLAGTSTTHRSMMDHVAGEADDGAAPDGHEDAHPGLGTHLAGACSAILAAAFVVLAVRRRFDGLAEPAEHGDVRPTVPLVAARVGAVARGGPPRLALCVELR